MKLVYPACFYPRKEGGYTVVFPDLPGCVTEGDSLSETVDRAADAASGWLMSYLDDMKRLPNSSDIRNVVPDEHEGGFVSLISVDLDDYAQKYGVNAIKKTLTIPAWLNTIAEENNVNFSQILQSALRKHLGLD